MKRVISDMQSWLALTLLVEKRLEKNKKPFMITIGKAPKTHEQLGYLHSEVLPRLTQALFDSGEIACNSERYGKYWLKVKIKYGEWIRWPGGMVFDDDSFANADIDILTSAIDTAIFEAAQRDVYIAPPKGK